MGDKIVCYVTNSKLGEVCVPSKGRKPVLGGQSLFCIPVVIGGNICKFDKSAYGMASTPSAHLLMSAI